MSFYSQNRLAIFKLLIHNEHHHVESGKLHGSAVHCSTLVFIKTCVWLSTDFW